MDNDDLPVGRILTRREALALLSSASLGAAFLAACRSDGPPPPAPSPATGTPARTSEEGRATAPGATAAVAIPSCIVRPALTEGPFFVDKTLERSDVRVEPSDNRVVPGVPLVLTFQVASVAPNACSAAAGVMVDLWQCDAAGRYSDVQDAGSNTVGMKFLRGYQVTDAGGKAVFTTIYPGWYPGRATHIHFKIRSGAGGKNAEFTSQLFFDDAVSDQIYAQAPYNKPGTRTRNANDGIYRQDGGKLLLNLSKTPAGYASTFEIGLESV